MAPVTPCEITPIPASVAEDMPVAYYFPPANDGSRPGTYFVNTADPGHKNRFETASVAYHEAIPGHYIQLMHANKSRSMVKTLFANGSMIQGWAVVDNTQDEDWENVQLSLIAGLPVSFVHDLYTPRYVRRPVVAVQETTGVLPPEVEGGMEYGLALRMSAERFQKTQAKDGGWGYVIASPPKNTMTCVGLIGLAMGHGAAAEIFEEATAKDMHVTGELSKDGGKTWLPDHDATCTK